MSSLMGFTLFYFLAATNISSLWDLSKIKRYANPNGTLNNIRSIELASKCSLIN